MAGHRPSPREENEFIRLHGLGQYAKWILGLTADTEKKQKRITNFRLAISRHFTAVAYSRSKPARMNMAMPRSKLLLTSY